MRRLCVVAAGVAALGAMWVSPAVAQQEEARSLLGPVSWVSTGDSYSSGEGIVGNEGACAVSRLAFGPAAALLLRERGVEVPNDVFSACTGHLVEDMFNRRSDADGRGSLWEWAREQEAPPRVDVITMSFGGNDIGFGDVIEDCLVAPDSWADFLTGLSGCDTSEADIEGRVDSLIAPLRDDCVGGRIKGRAVAGEDFTCTLLLDDRGTPDTSDDERGTLVDFYVKVALQHLTERGVLAVVNYPKVFAPTGEWPGWSGVMCAGVKRGDADRLGRLADRLNDRIANAVKGANTRLGAEQVVLVDRAEVFRSGSHELCGNGQDWLNGVSAFRGTDRVQLETSFHPNLAGHQGIAAVVADRVEAGLIANTPPFAPTFDTPYVIFGMDLQRRTMVVAPWTFGGVQTTDGTVGGPRTVAMAPDLSVRQQTRNQVDLGSFAAFLNANPTPLVPERFFLSTTGGKVSQISPFIDDGGDGEGYDFDYCWTAGYSGITLDSEIVDCPADVAPGVVLIQEDLNTLGYGPITVDGVLGPRTLGLLARLRADNGYSDSGRADGSTLNLLKAQAVEFARSSPPTPGPAPALTSCEGTDMSLASGYNLGDVVCSFPWALISSSDLRGGAPTAIVDLISTIDRSNITTWYDIEDGTAVSGYTVDSIAAFGVPLDVAQLLFDALDA